MDKPGTHHMMRGAYWLVIGSALTAGSLWLFQWEAGVLFYGAIIVGSFQLIYGVWQRIEYAMMSPERKTQRHAEATMITLLRCMAMVANADGRVDEREIATIRGICKQLFGTEPSEELIRGVVSKVEHGGDDPAEFVASLGTQVPLEARVVIAKACSLVMAADGEVSKKEERVYKEIIDGLGIRLAA